MCRRSPVDSSSPRTVPRSTCVASAPSTARSRVLLPARSTSCAVQSKTAWCRPSGRSSPSTAAAAAATSRNVSSGFVAELGEDRELYIRRAAKPGIERVPGGANRRGDQLGPGRYQLVCDRRRIVHLERHPEMRADPGAAHLNVVDVVDLRPVGELQGGAPSIQDHHLGAAIGLVALLLPQTELIAIEPHGILVRLRLDHQPQLADLGCTHRTGCVSRLASLDRPDHRVSDWEHDHFDGNLVDVAGHGVADQAAQRRKHAREGDDAEQRRVGELADDRGTHQPSPHSALSSPLLDPDENIGVKKLAGQVAAQARNHDAWHEAEHSYKRLLVLIAGAWRRGADREEGQGSHGCQTETHPDGAPGLTQAVHLGKHVAQDVGQREQDGAAVSEDAAAEHLRQTVNDRDGLRRGDVGDQQQSAEGGHDNGVDSAGTGGKGDRLSSGPTGRVERCHSQRWYGPRLRATTWQAEIMTDVYDDDDRSEQLDQLEPERSLDDRGVDDPLDEGYSPPEKPSAAMRHGDRETLDERLDAEEADVSSDDLGNDFLDDGEVGGERAGRLVEPNQGIGPDNEKDLIGDDVGIDGAAASAEEAAMHIVPDEWE